MQGKKDNLLNILLRTSLWISLLYLLNKQGLKFGIEFGFALLLGELSLRLELIRVIKFGKLFLELKSLKRELYADINTVKKIALRLSNATAYSLSRVGRFAPKDLHQKTKSERQMLYKLLKDLNISEGKIKDTLKTLDDIIKLDAKKDNNSKS
jgi:hypothetical protein